jgi:hypothetical protein
MMRSFIIAFLSVTIFLGACSEKSKTNQSIEIIPIYHYNIILAPDLSNRINMAIHPKPLDDQSIISIVLSMTENILQLGYRETDQKDTYSFTFINPGLIRMFNVDVESLSLDFSQFSSQSERMDFIKGRKDFVQNGLKEKKEAFASETQIIYGKALTESHGADIWSFLENRLDETHIKVAHKPFVFLGKTYQDEYRNILILLTDGYIESGQNLSTNGSSEGNLSYDLSQSRIRSFRQAYISSGRADIQTFFEENNYGIVPLNNTHLKDLEILVLELYDRSLTVSGNATIHPTDADIIELFWTDWLQKSQIKRFELKSYFSDEKQAEASIRKFIMENPPEF